METKLDSTTEVTESEGTVPDGGSKTLSKLKKEDGGRIRKRKRHLMTQKSRKRQKISHKLSSSCDVDPVATPTGEDDDVILDREMKEWVELGVPHSLTRALYDLKFHRPTEIQRRAIPLVAKGDNDIIGAAKTVSIKVWKVNGMAATYIVQNTCTIKFYVSMVGDHSIRKKFVINVMYMYMYFLTSGIWKDASIWYSHSQVYPQ